MGRVFSSFSIFRDTVVKEVNEKMLAIQINFSNKERMTYEMK